MLTASLMQPIKAKKILLAHSNVGETALGWHRRRQLAARGLGYNISMFPMAEHHAHVNFPKLEKLWKRRDSTLMKLYEVLGAAIDKCDVFIHFNGLLIHPEFLQQFKKLTIYHCADDPDASSVVSRPVAASYNICAISNPACIDMYKSWGCRNTFFWPLGSFSYQEDTAEAALNLPHSERSVPLVFVGSKRGIPRIRYLGRYLGLYRKTGAMKQVEKAFPSLVAYGDGWSRGRIDDAEISKLYQHSRVGFNLHNTLGPINSRLYDLAAFGVCQICDNKRTLSLVFKEGTEIIGFESNRECIELIRYYLAHPAEAERVGEAARRRFMRDYSMTAIWTKFFTNVVVASVGK